MDVQSKRLNFRIFPCSKLPRTPPQKFEDSVCVAHILILPGLVQFSFDYRNRYKTMSILRKILFSQWHKLLEKKRERHCERKVSRPRTQPESNTLTIRPPRLPLCKVVLTSVNEALYISKHTAATNTPVVMA